MKQIDYCKKCRDTTKCKKCRKSPFQKSFQDEPDADMSGGTENLLIAAIGAIVFLIIAYVLYKS